MKSKKILSIIILLLILGAIASLAILKFSAQEQVSPKRADVVEAVFGMGKVKSREKFDVKIGILTKVRQVYVREGDAINKGDTLISFEQGSPYTSPINGHITLVNINEGETALPQVPLIKVENLNNLYIEVSLEQSSALKVHRGQSAKVTFNDSNFGIIDGSIESIYPREDEFLVVIKVAELPPQVLPGMSADVSIIVASHKNVLLIPARAVNNDQVKRFRDSKTTELKVETGTSQGVWLQLLSGDIKESDKLLISKKE